MKIQNIINESARTKKLQWKRNPKLGWVNEGLECSLYYGTTQNNITRILKEGIYAGEDGYVLCSFEPNTALVHSTMRSLIIESSTPFSIVNTPVIVEIGFSNAYYDRIEILKDPHHRMDKKIYESWGKSDVEYYALIHIGVPNHVPVKFIKGYMVK